MAVRYNRSPAASAEITGVPRDHRDEEVMQALVTAGALVALSDGRVEAAERDELVNFVDQQGFVPTISRQEIAEAFGSRVRQLEDRRGVSVIVENLRPLAGLSRVAAADSKIHPAELQAIQLIRLVMKTLPARRSPTSNRLNDTVFR